MRICQKTFATVDDIITELFTSTGGISQVTDPKNGTWHCTGAAGNLMKAQWSVFVKAALRRGKLTPGIRACACAPRGAQTGSEPGSLQTHKLYQRRRGGIHSIYHPSPRGETREGRRSETRKNKPLGQSQNTVAMTLATFESLIVCL